MLVSDMFCLEHLAEYLSIHVLGQSMPLVNFGSMHATIG
jgi:hypothetical protein